MGEVEPLSRDQEIRLNSVLEIAMLSFWERVAEGYPEVLTGDFPPGADYRLSESCRNAIRLWLHFNEPDVAV